MKKNRNKQRAIEKKKAKEKEIIVKYFRTIIKKKYKNTLEVNKKGIPVVKNTDVPASVLLEHILFLGFNDGEAKDKFHLEELNSKQFDLIKMDVYFFANDVLEFLFQKEIMEYHEKLYAEEFFNSGLM